LLTPLSGKIITGMIDFLLDTLKNQNEDLDKIRSCFVERKVPAKTMLLAEGEIATHIFFVKSGCLRMLFNNDGKDITLQFFFEGQPVASIESFKTGQPSLFGIESIEPTTFISVKKADFEYFLHTYPELNEHFFELAFRRFSNYASLFLSRIKDSPQERYNDLVRNHPEIIRRVPQHYIASYLGITPISLSRIRNRK
jgi:CRP-like cAMP-binding protein